MSNLSPLVVMRLKGERRLWRAHHPHVYGYSNQGFMARPMSNDDGTINLEKWECQIPGPQGSIWEQGIYTLIMEFSNSYPMSPPKCKFMPVLPHPNIYPSGTVCLSILNEEEDWKSNMNIGYILIAIQKLLKEEPNVDSPAQYEPTHLYKCNRVEYIRKVKEFALSMKKQE